MNENDYDEDGNCIVDCPLCLTTNCPSVNDGGECPIEKRMREDPKYAEEFMRTEEKSVEEMVQEFRKTFADDNLWKDEINETAFVAIGNIENWIRDTLTTLIHQTRKERDEEIDVKIDYALALIDDEHTQGHIKYYGAYSDIHDAVASINLTTPDHE